jgi:uncharacterized protein YbjT (DUF2867 family)
MREQQLTAIRAIAASDVTRVVKISGSPVSINANSSAGTGRDHFEIEQALRAIGRPTVAIRPNPFMQNFLEQAAKTAQGALPGPTESPAFRSPTLATSAAPPRPRCCPTTCLSQYSR